MKQMKQKVSRSTLIKQNKVRRRAQSSVINCTKLVISMAPVNYRNMVRRLNDTIGMKAYEVVKTTVDDRGLCQVECYVPGRDLALLLKLTFGGQ